MLKFWFARKKSTKAPFGRVKAPALSLAEIAESLILKPRLEGYNESHDRIQKMSLHVCCGPRFIPGAMSELSVR